MSNEWYILIICFLLFLFVIYRFVDTDYEKKSGIQKTKIIKLQNDGHDYILYKGKIKELISQYHHYLTSMDITIYSKSIYIGLNSANKVYLRLSASAIQSVRSDVDKVIIKCIQSYYGNDTITIKGFSHNQVGIITKKINFIIKKARRLPFNAKKKID